MATITKKINWNEAVQNIANDKKRIEAYFENPQQEKPDGIKFVKPSALRTVRNK